MTYTIQFGHYKRYDWFYPQSAPALNNRYKGARYKTLDSARSTAYKVMIEGSHYNWASETSLVCRIVSDGRIVGEVVQGITYRPRERHTVDYIPRGDEYHGYEIRPDGTIIKN